MILGIVQARMGGTRLPGKVMQPLAGSPMIEHVVRRTLAADLLDHVIVAIPQGDMNTELAATVLELGVPVYGGSEDDVLNRFESAIRWHDSVPDIVVRITADDPFKDPELIDYAITAFLTAWNEPEEELAESGQDMSPHYLHLGGPTWPLGADVEVVSRSAIALADEHATEPYDREHVTPWIRRELGVWTLRNPHAYGANHRWTVDTPTDLKWAQSVYDSLYQHDELFGFELMRECGL